MVEYHSNYWGSLVSETQFATHQVREGIKSLARVTSPEQYYAGVDIPSLRYVLHNGMYHYSTGLERLAKLVLVIAEYRRSRRMPSVRKFGHDLENLTEQVGLLAEAERAPEHNFAGNFVRQELPDHAQILALVSSYAKGGKRYEYLDSLGDASEPTLYNDWMNLVAGYSSTPEIDAVLALPRRISAALSSRRDEDLDTLVWSFQERLFADRLLHGPSIRIALDCFRVARWLAAHLSWISSDLEYGHTVQRTDELFPVLGEVVDPILLHPAHVFLEAYILDYGSVWELEQVLRAMSVHAPPAEEDIWQEIITVGPDVIGGEDPRR